MQDGDAVAERGLVHQVRREQRPSCPRARADRPGGPTPRGGPAGSRPVLGSSSTSTRGSGSSALAISTRRCSPPESVRTQSRRAIAPAHGLEHVLDAPSSARRAGRTGGRGAAGSPRPSAAGRVPAAWNTTPSCAPDLARLRRTSWPPRARCPQVGVSSVAMTRNSVVLPPPLGPSSAKISPGATSKQTPRSASRRRNGGRGLGRRCETDMAGRAAGRGAGVATARVASISAQMSGR